MSNTRIYTTRKLEKVIAEFMSEMDAGENEFLGDWNSTLFYVRHKKCWLLVNKLTKYILILPNIKKSDFNDISPIFKKRFYEQLVLDGIETEYELIEKIIGKVTLHQTNNDKSAIGSLNSILPFFEDLKLDYDSFEKMPFRKLNGLLNGHPNKQLNWIFPKQKMNEMIKAFAQ